MIEPGITMRVGHAIEDVEERELRSTQSRLYQGATLTKRDLALLDALVSHALKLERAHRAACN
jgi:hypothetical protein